MAHYEVDNENIVRMLKEVLASENGKKFEFFRFNATDIQCVRVKGKKTNSYADVRKIFFPASLYTNKKWLISFYDSFDDLPEEKQKIVIMHELMHIDIDKEKLKKHNVEDFREILEIHGINWETN